MERDYVLIALIILSGILHIFNTVFGILAYTVDEGIFVTLSTNLTKEHLIQFTPETWVFFLWNITIWIWMTLIYIYLIVNIFRTNKDGRMYCNPSIFTTETCVTLSVSFTLNVVLLFLWNVDELVATVIVHCFLAVSNWLAVALFTIRLWKATPFLFHHTRIDLWIHRLLIQNGLAVYATWTTLEFFMKLAVAAAHQDGFDGDGAPIPSAVAAILLTFFLAITFPLDILLWEKHLRYLFAPHLVILWTVASIYSRLEKVHHRDETVRVYSLVLLVISALLFVGRNASMAIRHFKRPLVVYV